MKDDGTAHIRFPERKQTSAEQKPVIPEGEAHDVAWTFPDAEAQTAPEQTSDTVPEEEAEALPFDAPGASMLAAAGIGGKDEKPVLSEDEKKQRRKDRLQLLWKIPTVLVILAALGYFTFVFLPVPFVRKWRNIYIETAMTTGDHQWLATSFIPGYIIDDVMDVTIDTSVIGGVEHLTKNTSSDPVSTGVIDETEPVTEKVPGKDPHTDDPVVPAAADILGLAGLKVGGRDYAGNKVLIVDEEEGLFVSEINTASFKGRVMLIDDPSRVFVGTTPEKTLRGYRIREMIDWYGDCIAGINASGFSDPNDEGDGKDIIGYCMSKGETWGTFINNMASIVFTKDNRLVVGYINDWESYNIRDGMQFGPVLIADGKEIVDKKSTTGYGIHPRTAIGQREDGAIIMLVIDGRDILYSIGCTVGDLTSIMLDYGAYNAGCCDGGSSCVLCYNDEVINHNSSLNPTYGRRLPNAFLVKSKKSTK